MTMQDLRNLISFIAQAASEAVDPIQKARYSGMVTAFAFIQQAEIEARAKALLTAQVMA